MNSTTRHTSPCPVAEFQTTVCFSASGAGLARCVPATDPNKVDAFPVALVLKDGIEPADARICDAIGKVMVPKHTLHIQILDTDGTHLAVVRQLMSDFVDIVEPLVGNLVMYACDMMLNLLPSGRSLRLVTQFPLVMFQTLLSCLGKMRSSELTAIRADCKGLYTGVDANGCACVNSRTWLLVDGSINKDRSIVFPVRIHRDSHILDLAVEASVKNDRDILALRNAECLMFLVYTTVLRIMERLSILFAFEKGMRCSMLPPVLEGICDLLDCILQGLGVNLTEPWINLLQGGELLLSAETTYTDSTSAPHHRHIVQRAIVRNTATAEALGEELLLIRSRIEPIFERPHHDTNILIFT